jgi:hypothetical protein
MKSKTRSSATRGLHLLLLVGGLSLLSVADAQAHGYDYRPYVVHRHYAYSRPVELPLWIADDSEFQRWYLKNQHRLKHNVSWQRHHEIFGLEKPSRVQSRRLHGRVVHDHGYRTYWNKPKKRR